MSSELLLLLLTVNGFSPGGSGTTISQQTNNTLTTVRQHTIETQDNRQYKHFQQQTNTKNTINKYSNYKQPQQIRTTKNNCNNYSDYLEE
jgi:hypothetical protein